MIDPQVPLLEEVPPFRYLITLDGEPAYSCIDIDDALRLAAEAWQNTDKLVKIETIH